MGICDRRVDKCGTVLINVTLEYNMIIAEYASVRK